jgi:hypothetical protein
MKLRSGIIALSGLQLIAGSAFADLSVNGNWVERVTSANLTKGAGSNLIHEFVSAPGGTTLTISNLPPGSTWRLFARKADSTWKDKLLIHVRRTSGGSATIKGGDAYIQITNADTEIFSGTGNQAVIALQTKLSGMSIKIPPDTYSTSLIFTLQ